MILSEKFMGLLIRSLEALKLRQTVAACISTSTETIKNELYGEAVTVHAARSGMIGATPTHRKLDRLYVIRNSFSV